METVSGHKRNSISLVTFFLCYQWELQGMLNSWRNPIKKKKSPSSRENKIQLVKLSPIRSLNRNHFHLLGIKSSIKKKKLQNKSLLFPRQLQLKKKKTHKNSAGKCSRLLHTEQFPGVKGSRSRIKMKHTWTASFLGSYLHMAFWRAALCKCSMWDAVGLVWENPYPGDCQGQISLWQAPYRQLSFETRGGRTGLILSVIVLPSRAAGGVRAFDAERRPWQSRSARQLCVLWNKQ